MLHFRWLDADAGIFDCHRHPLLFFPGADCNHAAALVAGIGRIGQQIEKNLFDLIRHDQDVRQILCIVTDHGYLFTVEIAPVEEQDGVERTMHIHHCFPA